MTAAAANAARRSYASLVDAAQRSLAGARAAQEQLAQLQSVLARAALEREVAAMFSEGGMSDAVQVVDRYREEREKARLEVRRWAQGAPGWLLLFFCACACQHGPSQPADMCFSMRFLSRSGGALRRRPGGGDKAGGGAACQAVRAGGATGRR